jgi:hypothetical protein
VSEQLTEKCSAQLPLLLPLLVPDPQQVFKAYQLFYAART